MILQVSAHLTPAELLARFKQCQDADERLRWQAVLLKSEGRSAVDIADVCKRREDWVRRTVRAFNERGPDAMTDRRRENGREAVLDEGLRLQLSAALRGDPPDGGLWTSGKVANWITARTGTKVSERTGWAYLVKAGFTKQVPRPKHPDADEEAQEAFKKGGLRVVFTTSFEPTPKRKSRSGPRTRGASD